MPGFNTVPVSGGGSSQPNMTFVGSIYMSTYNRSWAQGGTAGNYGIYSANQEAGYAYFVGATTTGVPLNKMINVTHSFTRIDIIAPTNDMVSLYKIKVKNTSAFNNPFALFSSFLYSTQSSASFVLPSAALPLVNVLIAGGGGSGGRHGGGGGGGGSVVKLTALTAVGTTAITIGAGGPYNENNGINGGTSLFGSLYALGGGRGAQHGNDGDTLGNGGGGGGHSGPGNGGLGTVQTSATGLGFAATPEFFGGNYGARASGEAGGGGGGAGGPVPVASNTTFTRSGGPGHTSDISGSTQRYGIGGGGGQHSTSPGNHGGPNWPGNVGHGGHGGSGDVGSYDPNTTNSRGSGGGAGIVQVRYYIA